VIKNATLYALTRALATDELTTGLEKLPFGETTALQMVNSGWVPPFAGSNLVHEVDQVKVVALRVDTKVLPTSAVNMAVRDKAREIEEQQGYKPGRRQMKEIKEQVIDIMLGTAFSRTTITRVYFWDDMMLIDTGSPTVADLVMGHLAKCLNPFPVAVLHLKTAPAVAMTNWLLADEAPEFFTIDQEAELQSTDSRRAVVKFVRTSVPVDQIQDGRQCVKLAMTYADRVSFLLTDAFVLKRISPLDVIKEGREDYFETEQDRIDGEISLITRELRNLAIALISELGLKIEEEALV
jgi:recombination associated protein RdgC